VSPDYVTVHERAWWEARAAAQARELGVDENLPPRERCFAIARAFGLLPVLKRLVDRPQALRERVPGEDDDAPSAAEATQRPERSVNSQPAWSDTES
jgi:hypothetical protein